jgi:ParB-like chromosome segregation protein Spo0J
VTHVNAAFGAGAAFASCHHRSRETDLNDIPERRGKPRRAAELAVSYLALTALKPYGKNARTHSKKQIRQVADSIAAFGFTAPILIDEDNTILAGHARLAAAKLLNLAEAPCVRLAHMSKAEKRASAWLRPARR